MFKAPLPPDLSLPDNEATDPSSIKNHCIALQVALCYVIGPIQVANYLKTSSKKYIHIHRFHAQQSWLCNALISQLSLSDEQATLLSALIEKSFLLNDGFTEQDWQEYYEYTRNADKNDKSWIISAQKIYEIILFVIKDIQVNNDYCVPHYAGLSDDKKILYVDSSIKDINTPIGEMKLIDFIIFHRRITQALIEQSIREQLKRHQNPVQFACPLEITQTEYPWSHEKRKTFLTFIMQYQYADQELKLSYQVNSCDEKENAAIQNMNQQAANQRILSYDFAFQLADRFEQIAIDACGLKSIWESYYLSKIMNEKNNLEREYHDAYNNNQALMLRPTPPALNLLPYTQRLEYLAEMDLLKILYENKLRFKISACTKNLSQTSSASLNYFFNKSSVIFFSTKDKNIPPLSRDIPLNDIEKNTEHDHTSAFINQN